MTPLCHPDTKMFSAIVAGVCLAAWVLVFITVAVADKIAAQSLVCRLIA